MQRCSAWLVLLFFLGEVALGQESLRMSLASAESAAARRRAASTVGYYNLQLGPTAWSFAGALGIQANDNIQLVESNPKSDVIISPEINARMVWPVSQVNSLNLALGVGYSAYVINHAFSRFYVTPGSELSFDLYAGDFWINFHDRFSILQNTYQDPTVVGSADYSRLENALGVGATWDLNKALVKAGYDHINYVSLYGAPQTTGTTPDGSSEVFTASGGLALRPGTLSGLELGASLIHYNTTSTSQFYTDATQWNAGGFFDSQVSDYVRSRISLGYTVFLPQATGGQTEATDYSGLYAQIILNHRLNQYVDYSLAGGRNITFAFYGGTVDMYYARLDTNLKLVRKIGIRPSFEYEHGTQLTFYSETFNRFGPAIALDRLITSKLTASLSYQYFWRGSDDPGRSYTVNLLTARAVYKF